MIGVMSICQYICQFRVNIIDCSSQQVVSVWTLHNLWLSWGCCEERRWGASSGCWLASCSCREDEDSSYGMYPLQAETNIMYKFKLTHSIYLDFWEGYTNVYSWLHWRVHIRYETDLPLYGDAVSAEDDDENKNEGKMTRYFHFRQDVGHLEKILDNIFFQVIWNVAFIQHQDIFNIFLTESSYSPPWQIEWNGRVMWHMSGLMVICQYCVKC